MWRGRSSASPSVESTHEDNHQEESGPNNSKRRRIALACSACRTRKSRCNGQRPKCSLCERMGFECTYEMPNSSSNLIIGKDIFAALEARVEAVERQLRRQSNHTGSPSKDEGTIAPSSVVNSEERNGEHTISAPPGMIVISIQDPLEADAQSQNDKTDGMAMSLVKDEDCSFFGPTSNIALMRTIFRAVAYKRAANINNTIVGFKTPADANRTSAINLARAFPESPNVCSASGDASNPGGCNILPSHEQTEQLVNRYFSNTGMLFPYIHKPSFVETYSHIREQNFRGNVRRTFLGLLNMVLAMAAWSESGRQSTTRTTSHFESAIFYQRAQELCGKPMQRGTSLETVQFLLLTSQYLQGTQQSVQTWAVHGLAVKAAMSIGIHSKEALRRLPDVEQEMGKRTWLSCVLLDRHLSMTFGRPSAIPDDYVRLDVPRLVQGDHIDRTGISFFAGTVSLYKILWHIMGSLYGHNLGCEETSDTNMITQIFLIQHELNEWQDSLGPGLSLVTPENMLNVDSSNPIGERYRFVLTMRYLHAQLLLYRPVLTKLLSTDFDSSQSQQSISQMQLNLSDSCTDYARKIIYIVHSVLTRPDLGKHFLGAWWFTLYYVFNASLLVFGSLFVPKADNNVSLDSVSQLEMGQHILGQAIEALLQLDQDNQLLSRCIRYLQDLQRVVKEWVLATPSATATTYANLSASQPHILINKNALVGKINTDLPLEGIALDNSIGLIQNLEFDPSLSNDFQRWFDDNAWSADIL
uniref:Zn(2)-C6 fungal-type domain-containing protein n=1 Tax=Bionectria ochroleuca TaxID=29856 RepID=A0A0B7KNK2_BIOOC